jgi:DEAD/DEAH box helicase domain-containing protein
VHSPKCGSGNRPIDKASAIFILEEIGKDITGKNTASAPFSTTRQFVSRVGKKPFAGKYRSKSALQELPGTHYAVFDLETQLSAQEVGGWHRADEMGLSCGVIYDSREDAYFEYTEDRVPELIKHLLRMDIVVGFNVKRFDYRVLSGYTSIDLMGMKTVDILEVIHRRLGFRISLDHLARETLGIQKSADGLQALKWWREGKVREIFDYCRKDVEITRDIYVFGKEKGHLLFRNKSGAVVRVPVAWGDGAG